MSADVEIGIDAVETGGMDRFFEKIAESNPFLSSAVNDPVSDEVDVEAIHRREFDDLVGYAGEALRARTHIGQVVWGEPGIGKSHLLARLCRWADADDRACCVFLHNIQPSPEHLPDYVLKCVVQRLVRGRDRRFHGTTLYRLLVNATEEALRQFPCGVYPPGGRQAREAFRRLVSRLLAENPNAGPDARTIYEVLFHFFLGAYREKHGDGDGRGARLALRWLQGDGLDQDEAKELQLRCGNDPEHPARLLGVQAIESVLLALADLAGLAGKPLILCFDQVDNLSPEQVTALTQFLHPLVDHARNLLVITSGVQSKLLQFVEQGVVLRAAWERLAQDERGVRLGRISRDEARQMLEARLERFFQPFMRLPAVLSHLADDVLFPLGQPWFEQRTADLVDFRPRDVINWARDRWRDQQRELRQSGGPAWLENWSGDAARGIVPPPELSPEEIARRIDEQTARKIGQQIARRQQEPETLPADAGNLAGLVETLLRQCVVADYGLQRVDHPAQSRGGRLPAYHSVLCSQQGDQPRPFHTGVAFVATANRPSMAAALRRLTEDPQPPERVVLVCEERLPLDPGPKGQEYLETLRDRGSGQFETLELSFHEYAELDALQAVVGDARTGDLEVDLPGGHSRRVSEEEAIASHHRQDRYRRHRLLALLLGQ